MKRAAAVGAVLAAVLATRAVAAEHVVANAEELTKAMRGAAAGDVVVLKDGKWKDVELVLDAKGADAKPITVRAQTPGRVVLSGNSTLRIAGQWLVVDGLRFADGGTEKSVIEFRDGERKAEHCRLTNCAIVNYNPEKLEGDGAYWVNIDGRHNRVDHCYFEGKRTGQPTLQIQAWPGEPAEHVVDHNHFGPRPPLGRNGGETMRIGYSHQQNNSAKTTVEYNLFDRCDGENEIISSKSSDNVYRYNTFRDCSGMLTLRHGNRCVIDSNFFFGNNKRGSGGVRIIGEDHKVTNNYFENLAGEGSSASLPLVEGMRTPKPTEYYQVKRAVVAFNTFVNCKEVFVVGVGLKEPERVMPIIDTVVANNLVVGKGGTVVRVVDPKSQITWQGNLLGGGAEAGAKVDGFKSADVKLVGDEVKRPAPGSAAIGAAVGEFDWIDHDIDGQPRSGKKDVGCDQSGNGEVKVRPLTKADVGPAWMRER